MLHRRRLALAAFIVVTLAGTTAAASDDVAERRMQAQALLERGHALAEHDPKGALAAYRSSYDIDPDFRVLYVIGRTCARLGDNACTARAYDQYLRDGGAHALNRREIEATVRALTPTLGTLSIASSVDGADIAIDGVAFGKTPIGRGVLVSRGTHKVTLTAEGVTAERTVSVAAGSTIKVNLDSASPNLTLGGTEPTTDDEVRPQTAPETKPQPRGPVPILPWAAAGALAVGTFVTGVLAANAYSDYESTRESYPIRRSELDESHAHASDMLVVVSIFGAATLVATGLAVYATLTRSAAPVATTAAAKGFTVRW